MEFRRIMSGGIKYLDPRAVTTFAEFLGRQPRLPPGVVNPYPVQKKMLAVNRSKASSIIQSLPGTGKSLAALLSLKFSSPDKFAANLVLVPGSELAEQYLNDAAFVLGREKISALFRTGSVTEDEKQHKALSNKPQTLVCTPTRLMDYIHYKPDLIPIQHIERLVIDELDVYTRARAKGVLGQLIDFMFQRARPILTIMTSDMREKYSYTQLAQLLGEQNHEIFEIKEPLEEWSGSVAITDPEGYVSWEKVENAAKNFSSTVNDVKDAGRFPKKSKTKAATTFVNFAKMLKQLWRGDGIVLIPEQFSSVKFAEFLQNEHKITVTVGKASEVAGLNFLKLENIYILGWDETMNIQKLAWTTRGAQRYLGIGVPNAKDLPKIATEVLDINKSCKVNLIHP